MGRNIDIEIDPGLCSGCSNCLSVCPCNTLSIDGGKAWVTGKRCVHCGHCAGACPSGAIKVRCHDRDFFRFNSFESDPAWTPYGKTDTGSLVNLMASRRSCRSFSKEDVDRRVLEDLVKIGTTAPSGTNSQKWTFTVVENRKSMLEYGGHILNFYRKANKLAEKSWLRCLMKLAGKKKLDHYYRRFYRLFKALVRSWDCGDDKLFHGATAAILVGGTPGGSCPREDALLATQNILLAAHSMGVGTCLIGFAEQAMKQEPAIGEAMGLASGERVYAVIGLGYPREKYHRVAGRNRVQPRWFSV